MNKSGVKLFPLVKLKDYDWLTEEWGNFNKQGTILGVEAPNYQTIQIKPSCSTLHV